MTLAMSALNELHPLVVHFPIALLLVVTLFVLMGALWHRGGQLVHEFGVHAKVSGRASSAASLH